MAPRATTQSSHKEADIQLAISAIDQNQVRSETRVASTYNVTRTTLRSRRAGRPSRYDTKPKSKKLTKLEEEVAVRHILDLDSQVFELAPPRGLC